VIKYLRNEYVVLWVVWVSLFYLPMLVTHTTSFFYTMNIMVYFLLVTCYLMLTARDVCFKYMKSLLLLFAIIGCVYNLVVHADYVSSMRIFYERYPFYINMLNSLELSVLLVGTIIRILQIERFRGIFLFSPIHSVRHSIAVCCRKIFNQRI